MVVGAAVQTTLTNTQKVLNLSEWLSAKHHGGQYLPRPTAQFATVVK